MHRRIPVDLTQPLIVQRSLSAYNARPGSSMTSPGISHSAVSAQLANTKGQAANQIVPRAEWECSQTPLLGPLPASPAHQDVFNRMLAKSAAMSALLPDSNPRVEKHHAMNARVAGSKTHLARAAVSSALPAREPTVSRLMPRDLPSAKPRLCPIHLSLLSVTVCLIPNVAVVIPPPSRLHEHLLGYWNFEDGPGSTTANDASGNGHTGRIHGGRHDASKWPQSGLAGGSYAQDFRGTVDDTMIVGNKAGFPTGNSPRTTMLWSRPQPSHSCTLPSNTMTIHIVSVQSMQ